ncbi:hypothetical protein ONE63_003573 [Megalurothrips usitatus]|uniref:Uncharacterized protein n=1 Tax=Megalurothrips usitatus TaxID=439358 RepID=A0AAV7X6W9_9NEOP|nr:hypothetical protein ONE63_003573 [Megalurothrips usitatus]
MRAKLWHLQCLQRCESLRAEQGKASGAQSSAHREPSCSSRQSASGADQRHQVAAEVAPASVAPVDTNATRPKPARLPSPQPAPSPSADQHHQLAVDLALASIAPVAVQGHSPAVAPSPEQTSTTSSPSTSP